MEWCYLLVFDLAAGKHDCIKDFLDRQPAFSHWYTWQERVFLVKSSMTAEGISEVIRKFTLDKGQFLVLNTYTMRAGWLPPPAWEMMESVKFDPLKFRSS